MNAAQANLLQRLYRRRAVGGAAQAQQRHPNPVNLGRAQHEGGVAWGGQVFQTPERLVNWINAHGGHQTVGGWLTKHPGAFGNNARGMGHQPGEDPGMGAGAAPNNYHDEVLDGGNSFPHGDLTRLLGPPIQSPPSGGSAGPALLGPPITPPGPPGLLGPPIPSDGGKGGGGVGLLGPPIPAPTSTGLLGPPIHPPPDTKGSLTGTMDIGGMQMPNSAALHALLGRIIQNRYRPFSNSLQSVMASRRASPMGTQTSGY